LEIFDQDIRQKISSRKPIIVGCVWHKCIASRQSNLKQRE